MKKLLLAILVIAVAMPAFASETRVRSLGNGVAPYIHDDSNVFMWPATLVGYANLVTITAGYSDVVLYGDDRGWFDDDMTAMFGLTYGLGEDNKYGVFGMWWHEHTMGPNDTPLWWGGDWDYSEPLYNKWNIMWALGFESFDIGVRFERADEAMGADFATGEEAEMSASYTKLGLGLGWALSDETNFDFAFEYRTNSYKDQGPGDTDYLESDAASGMTFRARAFHEWTEMITLVPYASYRFGDLSLAYTETPSYGDPDECWGLKGFMLDFGIAGNIQVNDDNMIILGIEPYKYHKGEPSECGPDAYKETVAMTVFPGFIFGFESDVKDWLTFRAGCDKTFIKVTMTEDTADGEDEMYMTAAPFNWYLGLGFHVADFDIDVLLNKEVPFSMGYWLTGFRPEGGDDAGAPIGMISLTYGF